MLRRLAAFFSPVVADAGAVTDDLVSLDLADGIYQAFGDLDADGGLTRSELAAACADLCDQATFDSRFELFCRMGMLLPVRDKAHQIRYVFNPTSAAALLVFERLVIWLSPVLAFTAEEAWTTRYPDQGPLVSRASSTAYDVPGSRSSR